MVVNDPKNVKPADEQMVNQMHKGGVETKMQVTGQD